jgi:hypothetical protein
MTGTKQGAETAARANYAAQREAMVAGDAESLGRLLSEDFVLTHMTGYRQSRAEWLADVASGAMTYHSIQDVSLDIDHQGFPAQLTLSARTQTLATIWGSRGMWPLQLATTFKPVHDQWLASATVASTW